MVKNGQDMIIDLHDLMKLREMVNWFFDCYFDEPTQTLCPPWYGINIQESFDEVMREIWDNVEYKIGEQMAEIIKYPDLLTNSNLHLVDGEVKEDLDMDSF